MPFSLLRAIRAAALTFVGALTAAVPTGATVAHAAGSNQPQPIRYPWAGTDDLIAVNLATGSLRESLIMWLTSERGVHAETLLVSIGAIAGFAAQAAVNERIKNRDIPGATKDMPRLELSKLMHDRGLAVSVTGKSGEKYYFGDLINGYMVKQSTTVDYHLFGILAGAAMQSGVKYEELPDCIPMFDRASKTIGTPEFGILNPPKPLSPQFTPREALDRFWPEVKFIFERTDGQGGVPPAIGHNVKPEYWPLVSALVAQQLLLYTKDTIDPRVAVALIMESAIVMSKIDPETVPQQRPPDAPPQPPLKSAQTN
jgi:hypothetical protein